MDPRRLDKFRLGVVLAVLALTATVLDDSTLPIPSSPVCLKGDFVPFGMCMGGMSPADQVAYCRKTGFSGLGIQDMDKKKLAEFAEVPEVSSGVFKIHSVLWWTNVKDPALDTVWFDGILEEARKLGTAIWMVSDGPDKTDASKSRAVSMIRKAADRCRAKGVRLVLYPHGGCVFASAEEGLQILDSLRRWGHPEVRLSIHLCHELKAGNGDRIGEVVAKVAPYLEFASVSGADADTYGKDDDNWASAIKPLDRGSYDVHRYLAALAVAGYSGPVQLHTYNLKSPIAIDYDRHIERSRTKWMQMVQCDSVCPGVDGRR